MDTIRDRKFLENLKIKSYHGFKAIKNFYRNKRIFITGHTGFKGMWLFLILRFFGATVKGYSLSLSKNDNFIFFRLFKKNFKKKLILMI